MNSKSSTLDKVEERKDIIACILNAINIEPSYYELKRVSIQQIYETVEKAEQQHGSDIFTLFNCDTVDETQLIATTVWQLFPKNRRKRTSLFRTYIKAVFQLKA